MADYRSIADTEVDPDAPVTSDLAYALRDNPIAIAEGATGAPRIVDAALQASGATNNGGNFVGNRMGNILSRSGTPIGTLMLAVYSGPAPQVSYNESVDGANLNPTNVAGTLGPSIAMSGRWTCLGYVTSGGGATAATTLWARTS